MLRQSGAALVEVGTTNRTYARDYAAAIGPQTALLMRIHTSNFKLVGFVHETPLSDMAEVARAHFPHLKIIARTYNHRHAFELMKREIDAFERETFEGALRLGGKALKLLGYRAHRAERAAGLFRRHDERTLIEMASIWSRDNFDAYRAATVARQGMIEDAMRRDMASHNQETPDDAWDTGSLDEEAAKRA